MALNMDAVFSKLGEATNQIEGDIESHLNSMDSSNTTDMLKLQQMMGKWQIATQTQSNTTKTISEGLKSMTQNIR
jgi:hypothetical protein